MVTERIQVVVSERGAVTVRRGLTSIGETADSSAARVAALNRTLGASGPVAARVRAQTRSAAGAIGGLGVASTRAARGGVSVLRTGLTAVGTTSRRVGGAIGNFGRRLTNLGGVARGAAGGVDGLRGALAGFGVVLGIAGIARLSDEYTNMRNRLRLVTTSTQDLNETQARLIQISNDTRVELSTTALLYQRTATAVEALGINADRVANFVTGLNQATILSGASAIEATNAIRQLTQGLGQNELRGEEFRSVAEQLPFVLAVVAEATNRTAGELRDLAFSGGLTAKVLIESFEASSASIAALFANTDVTIGQSIAVLQTALLTFVGRSNEAISISSILADSILFVATNIDIFAIAVGGLASIIAIRFVAGAIGSAIIGLQTFVASVGTAIVVSRTFTIALFGVIGALRTKIGTLIAARSAILLNLALAFATARAAVVRFITVLVPGLVTALVTTATTSAGLSRALIAVRGAVTLLTRALLANPIFAAATVALFAAVTAAVALFGDRIRDVIQTVTSFTSNLLGFNNTSSQTSDELRRLTEEFERMFANATVATGAINDNAAAQRRLQAASAGAAASLASQNAQLAATPGAGGGGRGGGGGGGAPRVVVQRQSPELALQNDFLRVFGSIPAGLRNGDLSVEEGRALFQRQLQRRIRAQETAGQLDRSPIRFGGRGAPDRTPGFQNGGSFRVGGRGGIDQNVLSLNGRRVARVTRGEDVTVTPASRRDRAPVNVTFNVTTPDADSFQRSDSQILQRLSGALARAGRNS